MASTALAATAQAMVAPGKGLLAMDESVATCNKRFAALGIAQTQAARHAWRELLITAPGLGTSISGAILFDETIRQSSEQGTRFVELLEQAGILPGIKVDLGAKDMALHEGEKVTEGLDGLRERLRGYAQMGARFAKWRAVIGLGAGRPSAACIEANALALARYAALCQEAGLVPIVEPELLMDGPNTLQSCAEETHRILRAVFEALDLQGILLEGMILKPNMVTPGLGCPQQAVPAEVASATNAVLRRTVPAAVAGIAFLSGGQASSVASARLNAMNCEPATDQLHTPWPLSFSFGRALQQPALQIWGGLAANTLKAQRALIHRAKCNGAAVQGLYLPEMEHDSTMLLAS